MASRGHMSPSESAARAAPGAAPRDEVTERDRQALFSAANTIVVSEYASDVLGKHLLMFFIIGVLFAGSLSNTGGADPSLGLISLIVALMEFTIGWQIINQRSIQGVVRRGVSMFALMYLWWTLLMLTNVIDGSLRMAMLVLIILVGGMFPWAARSSTFLAVFGAGAVAIAVLREGVRFEMVIAAATALVVAQYLAISYYAAYMSRVVGGCIGRLCEMPSYAVSLVRLLAWQLSLIADSHCGLVITSRTTLERIDAAGLTPLESDSIYILGILDQVERIGRDEGVLSFSALGEQYRAVLTDWFGSAPHTIFYIKASLVVDEIQRELLILVPGSITSRVVGAQRCLRLLSGVSAVVRMALSAQRSRFQSSDMLLATERSISQRESELNHLVHLVNNVVQEVAIDCEQLRESLNRASGAAALSAADDRRIGQIERSVNALSRGVTDLKLAQEIMGSKGLMRPERVSLSWIDADLREYGEERARNKGITFKFPGSIDPELAVSVTSRAYLESCLRLVLWGATTRLERGTSLEVSVRSEGELVVIEISDTGPRLDIENLNEIVGAGSAVISPEKPESYLSAVSRFAVQCRGELSFGTSPRNVISLKLPRAAIAAVPVHLRSHWVLLVDDNADVTTFYARVADALLLKYSTASSVEAAKALLEEHGEPRLLITDLQLGNESGLDLARLVRERYGPDLPIIVVSGRAEEEVRRELKRVGVNCYLTKPVGRRKLFEEIHRLLGPGLNIL